MGSILDLRSWHNVHEPFPSISILYHFFFSLLLLLSLSICLSFPSLPYLSDISHPFFATSDAELSWELLNEIRDQKEGYEQNHSRRKGRGEKERMEEDEIRKGGKNLSVSSLTDKAHSTDILFTVRDQLLSPSYLPLSFLHLSLFLSYSL